MTGTIPESIGELTQLQTLELSRTPVARGMTCGCGLCTSWMHLGHSRGVCRMRVGAQMRVGPRPRGGTELTGAIPESIGELTQLQTLNLDGTPRARGMTCGGGLCISCRPPWTLA